MDLKIYLQVINGVYVKVAVVEIFFFENKPKERIVKTLKFIGSRSSLLIH